MLFKLYFPSLFSRITVHIVTSLFYVKCSYSLLEQIKIYSMGYVTCTCYMTSCMMLQ